MKVLVCGGRDYQNSKIVNYVLDTIHKIFGVSIIVHGAQRGADSLGNQWAVDFNRRLSDSAIESSAILIRDFPGKWKQYGNAAGPIRNKQMLDECRPDLVVAFPGGKGTRNMISLSLRYKIQTIIVEHTTSEIVLTEKISGKTFKKILSA